MLHISRPAQPSALMPTLQSNKRQVSPELFQLFTASRLQLSKVMNVAAPPHHTITTTLLALAWHAINPASPSHEALARKRGGEKKTAATPRKHTQGK